ncbi:MAG: amidase domain-containing protein [Eubacteriales bacterium]|nr:amidase domain-containing protein [Eubacteriales bacterium]
MAYDREAAASYARRWAFSFNPEFYNFSDIGGDCTNFASQCLLAGGLEMNFTPVFGWYYISVNNRTPSWTGVNELYNFLISNRGVGPKAVEVGLPDVQLADLIQLELYGDDSFDHTPVVVDVGMGTPDTVLVAAHTNAAYRRPLSTYNYRNLRCLHIYD